jgi:hypothetical protein
MTQQTGPALPGLMPGLSAPDGGAAPPGQAPTTNAQLASQPPSSGGNSTGISSAGNSTAAGAQKSQTVLTLGRKVKKVLALRPAQFQEELKVG